MGKEGLWLFSDSPFRFVIRLRRLAKCVGIWFDS